MPQGWSAQWKEQAVMTAAQGTVVQRMERAVIIIRDQVKVLSNRGNSDGKHPSKPGEPPKRVTGEFVRTLTTKVVKDGNTVTGYVGSHVPYQPRLELGFVGTDSKGRVYNQAPRPAFRLALGIARPTIKKLFGITG